jgi:transcriptional regulator with XRE-family HTH domain
MCPPYILLAALQQTLAADLKELKRRMRTAAHSPEGRGQSLLEYLRENLVLGRAKARLSQSELAKRAAIARTTLSRLESQEVDDVGLRTLGRLALALGTTITALLSAPEIDLADRDELARRAADDVRDDIPAPAFLAALREADGFRRYSRAGRRRKMER